MRYYRVKPGHIHTEIFSAVHEWNKVLDKAKELARKVGASTRRFSIRQGVPQKWIHGFYFKDESKVDRTLFTNWRSKDGSWRPRKNTWVAEKCRFLRSGYLGTIMNAIGMRFIDDNFQPQYPIVSIKDGSIYLAVPDGVSARGCIKITQSEYESATIQRRKRRTVITAR